MEYEWDESKRRTALGKHGVDFQKAAFIFEGPVLTVDDRRKDYGELRQISIGVVDGEIYVVVHTDRSGVIRIISAWKGGEDDRERYYAGLARGTASHPRH